MQEVRVNKKLQNTLSISKGYLIVKRIFDIIFSLIGLVLCIPIILLTVILVLLESKGNPIYSQERVGSNNKIFAMYKIRSMRLDAEKNGPQWASNNDPRVTKIGSFIRKTRIDELPQLWNVLKGDMSLIGPRPEREIFYQEFEKTIPNFRERLRVKPGITGYAQVNGGYDLKPQEKLKLDLIYINNLTLSNELKIILKTFRVLLTGEGAR
ncbi:MAG: exopolysaccharide biosynthesis polyprenyl glycosylphosphotransferase [Sarcina sp.]